MTEFEKMIAGKIYDPNDSEIVALRQKAHRLNQEYNCLDETDPKREEILNQLIPDRKNGVYLQGPIYFDYGINCSFGENSYANFNFTVLDVCKVTIGDNVTIGAGSLVNRDIPAGCVAVGVPCKVIRKI